MTSKVSNLLTRIFYAIEVIPSYRHDWGETLYETYKSIIEDASLIDKTDAKDEYIFGIFGKNILMYSKEISFLSNLKKSKHISVETRQEVIGKLKSLDFAIRTATN